MPDEKDHIEIRRTTDGPLMINLSEDRRLAFMSQRSRRMTLDEYLDVSSFDAFKDAERKGVIKVSGVPHEIEEIRSWRAQPVEREREGMGDVEEQMEWDDLL